MKKNYLFEPKLFNYNKDCSFNMPNTHYHSTYEIYYLISGQRRYIVKDTIYDLYPGDMILIPTMASHKVINPPDIPPSATHERYLLTPSKEDIPSELLSCFDVVFYRPTPEIKQSILSFFTSLESYLKNNNPSNRLFTLSVMSAILCLLKDLPNNTNQPAILSSKETTIQNAATFIKNNCTKDLSLVDVATKYSYTPEYFSSLFKKTTGFKYSEYLTNCRIENAIHLLTSTKLTITEIAAQCGFNSANYFSEVFQKTLNTSPKNFRSLHTL